MTSELARAIILEKRSEILGRQTELPIIERLADPMDDSIARANTAAIAGERDRYARLLRTLDTALALVEVGEYGICVECDEPINQKRLVAVPWATTCIQCQEKLELQQMVA